jgi:hypothetical protein
VGRHLERVELQTEITPSRFAEVGRPYAMWWRGENVANHPPGLVALASAFDCRFWHGRGLDAGRTLRNRLSLYAGDFERRVAVCDAARFPINDVAFHASEPWLAIATGRYDGGYAFDGALYAWNWETGECRSLLAESRDVARCRFLDGHRLAVLLRPATDEEFADADAFTTFVSVVLDDLRPMRATALPGGERDPRLVNLRPVNPADLGFRVPDPHAAALTRDDQQHLARVGFEERARVWDVAWLDPERIATVHGGCHLELWRLPGEREACVRGVGHGVQLLPHQHGLLVHVVAAQPERSTLFALRGGSLEEWRRFDNPCSFSLDRHGRILARDISQARRDRIIDSSGQLVLEADLGHYDCFNHYIRLDGDDELYFLRGSPQSSYRAKHLCGIDVAGTVRERMRWDDEGEHLMDSCAALGAGGTIVRGFSPRASRPPARDAAIERFSLTEDRSLWRIDLDAEVTAIVTTGNYVVAALTSGHLLVIASSSGELLQDVALAIDKVPTVATALAVHGQRLLVGTIEGRLLLYTVREDR